MKKQLKCSSWMSVLLGVGVTIGILLVLLFVLSWILASVGVSDVMCSVLIWVIVAISWFIGAFLLGKSRRQNGLMWGMIHAGGMFVLVLLISLVANGANTSIFSVKTLLYLVVGALISGIGGIFGVHFALKRR